MVNDPYQVLGIQKGASQDEIKKAYRKKTKECHPDLHPDDPGATKKMSEINEAYDMLMNPEKYAQRAQQEQTYRQQRSQQQQYTQQDAYRQGYTQQGYGDPFGGFEGFDFDDLFGFGFGRQSYQQRPAGPTVRPGDSPEIQRVIQEINRGDCNSAVNRLAWVHSSERDARWHYLNALAHLGQGNTITALDSIKRACELDPDDPTYRQTLHQMQSSGRTYQENASGFNMDVVNVQRLCLGLCAAQMCCGFCRIC